MKLFLIVGLQRTGTTLLASMLGRHSEINMLFESVNKDVLKLIGKEWNGNKLLAYRQIRDVKRSSRWGHLVNRFYNSDFKRENKHHLVRPHPTSKMSIVDYQDQGAVFITIERDKESSISSMMKRAGQSYNQAEYEYSMGMKLINKLKSNGALSLTFTELVNNTESVLGRLCDFLDLKYEEKMLEGPKYNFVYPNDKIIKKKS